MSEERYNELILFMQEQEAVLKEVKTRDIADYLGTSVYVALHCLRELEYRGWVIREGTGRGKPARWRLVR